MSLRPLHVDKALDVINFAQVEPSLSPPEPLDGQPGIGRWLLCRNRYFVTERVEMAAGAVFEGCNNGDTLEIWGVTGGEVTIVGGGTAVDLA